MGKSIIFIAFVFSMFISSPVLASRQDWECISGEIKQARCVLSGPEKYLGAGGSIYKSENNSWRQVFRAGHEGTINFLQPDPFDACGVFAGTSEGLFYSPDSGNSWKRIFNSRDGRERNCTGFCALHGMKLLGTSAGLFVSDEGKAWNKVSLNISAAAVQAVIAWDESTMLAAVDTGLYRMQKDGKAQFMRRVSFSMPDAQEEQSEETGYGEKLMSMAGAKGVFYLATNRGVYNLYTDGQMERLPAFGLLSLNVQSLAVTADELIAATEKGVFIYSMGRWGSHNAGLHDTNVTFVSVDQAGNLYACTASGLFRSSRGKAARPERIISNPDDEPDIRLVREAAIKYAEVEMEKIKQWRKDAAVKAWLPQLSFDVSTDSADLWHWETGSTAREGDDLLQRGRRCTDWGMRLSWDLGNLIWNNDQTSIDVRSKLMVQLRDDIIGEVTRTYFERIRLKSELVQELPDKQKLDKELKVRELTALLDGMTGGCFAAYRVK